MVKHTGENELCEHDGVLRESSLRQVCKHGLYVFWSQLAHAYVSKRGPEGPSTTPTTPPKPPRCATTRRHLAKIVSREALTKAARKRNANGDQVCGFRELLDHLGTLTRNTVKVTTGITNNFDM